MESLPTSENVPASNTLQKGKIDLPWVERAFGSDVRIRCEELLANTAFGNLDSVAIIGQARQDCLQKHKNEFGSLEDVPFSSV